MGIFFISISSASGSGWNPTDENGDPTSIIGALTGFRGLTFGSVGPETMTGSMNTNGIYLDPTNNGESLPNVSPVGINSLPPGFTVDSAKLIVMGGSLDGGFTLSSSSGPFGGSSTFNANGLFEMIYNPGVTILQLATDVYNLTVNGTVTTFSSFASGASGIFGPALGDAHGSGFPAPSYPGPPSGIFIYGTYSIQSFSWYVDPTNPKKYKYGPNPGSNYIPASFAPIYHNPVTGDYITPPVGIVPPSPWIPWVPSNPITLTLPVIITPDIIPFIPVPFIPIPGIPPITFTPTVFYPQPPPIDIPPVPPFIPISFDPIVFRPIIIDTSDDFSEDSGFPILLTPGPPTDNGYSISIGGAATFQFIGSPSGIYTLVKGKTNDTLYDRTGTPSIDVAIPNPFVVTSFLGE